MCASFGWIEVSFDFGKRAIKEGADSCSVLELYKGGKKIISFDYESDFEMVPV